MTLIDNGKVNGDTSYSNTSWTEVLSTTVNLRRINIVNFCFEYGGEATNRDVGIRLTVDGAEVMQDYHEPSRANGYRTVNFCTLVEAPEDLTSYTIALEAIVESSPQVVHVRRKSFWIMQQ